MMVASDNSHMHFLYIRSAERHINIQRQVELYDDGRSANWPTGPKCRALAFMTTQQLAPQIADEAKKCSRFRAFLEAIYRLDEHERQRAAAGCEQRHAAVPADGAAANLDP